MHAGVYVAEVMKSHRHVEDLTSSNVLAMTKKTSEKNEQEQKRRALPE